MSESFSVDRDELLEVVRALAHLADRIAEAMESADRTVNQVHATWEGAAADAQRAAHRRWAHGCADMHAALVTMRQVAATAHANYSAAVEANVAMWRF